MFRLVDLLLLYGISGAREKFEEIVFLLLQTQYPQINRYRISQGDGGIDAYIGTLTDPTGIDVFQMKFFHQGIKRPQKNQIRESFQTCIETTQGYLKSWTLCLPINMTSEEETWFNTWKKDKVTDLLKEENIQCLGEVKLNEYLFKPGSKAIREEFFPQERHQEVMEALGDLAYAIDDLRSRTPIELVVRHHAKRNTLLRYAKDVYEPLYRELKTMLDIFELAQKGEGPYPRFIHGGDKSPELPSPVSLTLWSTQKTWFSFVRAFTSDARVKLDRIEQAVSSYNKAVGDLFPWMKETLVGALLNPTPNGNISRFFNDWDSWSQEHQKNEITVAQEWLSIQYPIFEWLLTNRGREIGWIPSDLWKEQFNALFFQKRLFDIFEAVREKRQSDEQQAYEYERRERNEESLDEDEREEYQEKTDVIYFWLEFERKQKNLVDLLQEMTNVLQHALLLIYHEYDAIDPLV